MINVELDKLTIIVNNLMDQEIDYQQEKGTFNKDRCGLINSMLEYKIPKQQRTTEQTGEVDNTFHIEGIGE